jgi:DNA polymerase phi
VPKQPSLHELSGLHRNDTKAVEMRRLWIVDQFAALLRNTTVPRQDDWIQAILDWFVVHGLFNIIKKSSKSDMKAVRFVTNM